MTGNILESIWAVFFNPGNLLSIVALVKNEALTMAKNLQLPLGGLPRFSCPLN
jgi:hypothetical protein